MSSEPPVLVVHCPGEPTYRVSLESATVRIGRSSGNEICLAGDTAVSRVHAEISVVEESVFIEDLDSRNGTFLDGAPVKVKTRMQIGSRIGIGRTVLRLTDPGDSNDVTEPGVPEPRPEYLSGHSVMLTATGFIDAASLGEDATATPSPETENSRSRAFAALSRRAPVLMGQRPLPEILELVLDMVHAAIAPDRAALLLLEGDPPRLEPRASRGMQPGDDGGNLVSTTIADRVIKKQQSILTTDAQTDPRFMQAPSIGIHSVHSAMSAPLWNNKEVIGMIYVDTVRKPVCFSKVDLEVLTLLANLSAIKIDHVRLFERDQKMRELEREVQAAAQIQRRLLPLEPPSFEGYDICGRNDPCHVVGGDYFDFLPRDDRRLAIAVGDVSGKGMGAALLMATLQASFRAHVLTGAPAETVVERLNRAVCANAESDKFITFFYGELDRETHVMHYVNAGHNPPMLFRRNGKVERLHTRSLILGFQPTIRYEARKIALSSGDLFVLFTDGVTEARNDAGEEFGEQRLSDIVRGCRQGTAAEITRRVRDGVDQFTGSADAFDDFTVCVIRRTA